ncbi:MAG: hypothetical protein ACHBNF_02290 [Chromatiales bacterium]
MSKLESNYTGVLVGALIALVSTFLSQEWTSYKEKKNLEYAFKGEISALLTIVKKKGLLNGVSNAIDKTKKSGNASFPTFTVAGNYFAIYNDNPAKLGKITALLAQDVATFYTHAYSIVETLNWMAQADASKTSQEKALSMLYHLHDVIQSTSNLGEKLVGPSGLGS